MNTLNARGYLPFALSMTFALVNCACGDDVSEGNGDMNGSSVVDAGSSLDSDAGIFDAGVLDAGMAPPDSGPPLVDAGASGGTDSGGMESDAGGDLNDAGNAMDSGSLADDAGIFEMDSGPALADSGTDPSDGGAVPTDGGGLLADAASDLYDGGLFQDAGASAMDSGNAGADANCNPVALNEAGQIPFAVQTNQSVYNGLDALIATGTADPGDVVTFTLRQFPDGGQGNVVAINQVSVECNGSFEKQITVFPQNPTGQFPVGDYQLRTHSSVNGDDLYTIVHYTGN
jgi:hypothetical protein